MVHEFPTEERLSGFILEMERKGTVTRTFRRLDPERRDRIIRAFWDEGVDRGPSGVTIRGIARRAGVSTGSLYQYFPGKEAVFEFACGLGTAFMTSLIREGAAYAPSIGLEDYLSMYTAYGVELSRDLGGFLGFFGRAAYSGESGLSETVVTPVAREMLDGMRLSLEAAAGRGELADDLDREAAVRVLNAFLTILGDIQLLPFLNVYFRIFDEEMTPERIMKTALRIVMKGIAANRSPAGPESGTDERRDGNPT